MSATPKKQTSSKAPPEGTPNRFESLLVPLDLTAISDRVVGRVSLLPLADHARITLLHVVPSALPGRARTQAERDAKKKLSHEALLLAKALPKTVQIRTLTKVGSGAATIAECGETERAELVVMGRGDGRALRDVFLGSTAERLIRRCQVPVLVVRLPARASYARPAIAMDLDETAEVALDALHRVTTPPRPNVSVIHAFDTPYGRVYPSLSHEDAEEWVHELERKVTARLVTLFSESLARAGIPPENAPRFRPHVRCGSARLIVERAVKKADNDLLVLGTHAYSGVAHLFLGTVAGDVLREVSCDVLIAPTP